MELIDLPREGHTFDGKCHSLQKWLFYTDEHISIQFQKRWSWLMRMWFLKRNIRFTHFAQLISLINQRLEMGVPPAIRCWIGWTTLVIKTMAESLTRTYYRLKQPFEYRWTWFQVTRNQLSEREFQTFGCGLILRGLSLGFFADPDFHAMDPPSDCSCASTIPIR